MSAYPKTSYSPSPIARETNTLLEQLLRKTTPQQMF
jgi:hypothetical protein